MYVPAEFCLSLSENTGCLVMVDICFISQNLRETKDQN